MPKFYATVRLCSGLECSCALAVVVSYWLLVKHSVDPPASEGCSCVGSFVSSPSLSKGGRMANWNSTYWPYPDPVALMSLVNYFAMIEIGENFDINLENKTRELLGF